MSDTGPQLESLLRHLSECPSEFWETCQQKGGAVQIAAIICDHFRPDLVIDSSPFVRRLLSNNPIRAEVKRHYALLAISVWLLRHPWFRQQSKPSQQTDMARLAWDWLQSHSLRDLSQILSADQFVADPDRREELARACLAALNYRPSGETQSQADDRRTTLDSVERKRVLEATAAAERRAREVREAMAKKKALESASRYGE
jgi:hypothetical protein